MAIYILVISFIVQIFLRVPIAFAMILSSVATTIYLDISLITIVQNILGGINGFTFMAIPFFILAGEIMSAGGISDRLIKFSSALVGWMRGGLAMVNIMVSMFFGGISGSATADTSSLGSILIPMMKKEGYDEDFATTVTMASSIQGLLVPPSHNMVIYALAAGGISIGSLFLAGLVPGIILGIALMIYSYYVSLKRNYPVSGKFDLKKIFSSFIDASLGLMSILIVVFGVITGIFTPTESASIAVVYSFIITFFVYREIPLRELNNILSKSIKTLSIVFILIAAAGSFGWLVAYLRIPTMIAGGMLSITTNKYLILLIINLMLMVLGSMMGMSSIIIIVTPILIPILTQIGIDPIHFGAVMILNLGIGLITPPVGAVLFVGSAVSGVKLEKLTKSMLPFYGVMLLVLVLITYVPQIVLFIPQIVLP